MHNMPFVWGCQLHGQSRCYNEFNICFFSILENAVYGAMVVTVWGVGLDGWHSMGDDYTNPAENESPAEAPQKMRIIIDQDRGILHVFLLEAFRLWGHIGTLTITPKGVLHES
jgi:hypothetical protein